MALVTQPYEEPRMVPWLGRLVEPGESAEIPDADLPNYLEAGWTPADQATAAAAAALAGEQAPPPADKDVPTTPAKGKGKS